MLEGFRELKEELFGFREVLNLGGMGRRVGDSDCARWRGAVRTDITIM
jgi:hypothetical protein